MTALLPLALGVLIVAGCDDKKPVESFTVESGMHYIFSDGQGMLCEVGGTRWPARVREEHPGNTFYCAMEDRP